MLARLRTSSRALTWATSDSEPTPSVPPPTAPAMTVAMTASQDWRAWP
jgi:hypothetical protein